MEFREDPQDAENDIMDIINGEHDSQIKQFAVDGLSINVINDQIADQIAADRETTGRKWRQQGYATKELVAGFIEEWTEEYIHSYGNNNTDEPTRADVSEAKQRVVEVMTKAIQQAWESVFGGVVDKAQKKKKVQKDWEWLFGKKEDRMKHDDDGVFDIGGYEEQLFDDLNRQMEKATDSLSSVMEQYVTDIRNDAGSDSDADEPVDRFKQTCMDAVDDIAETLKQALMRDIARF